MLYQNKHIGTSEGGTTGGGTKLHKEYGGGGDGDHEPAGDTDPQTGDQRADGGVLPTPSTNPPQSHRDWDRSVWSVSLENTEQSCHC